MQSERARIYKKWIDSGKRARLTEYESRILAEIQQLDKKRPVNEIKAFHRLINNALSNY
jgi:hypothetical protein